MAKAGNEEGTSSAVPLGLGLGGLQSKVVTDTITVFHACPAAFFVVESWSHFSINFILESRSLFSVVLQVRKLNSSILLIFDISIYLPFLQLLYSISLLCLK